MKTTDNVNDFLFAFVLIGAGFGFGIFFTKWGLLGGWLTL